jgi:hypothetical protein
VGGEDADGVAALGCYVCYEFAGLAGTEDQNAHDDSLLQRKIWTMAEMDQGLHRQQNNGRG